MPFIQLMIASFGAEGSPQNRSSPANVALVSRRSRAHSRFGDPSQGMSWMDKPAGHRQNGERRLNKRKTCGVRPEVAAAGAEHGLIGPMPRPVGPDFVDRPLGGSGRGFRASRLYESDQADLQGTLLRLPWGVEAEGGAAT